MDSIHKGLSEAKVNYSKCLRSLEVISDDIHQKRKDKKMLAMLANLQEREAGVGADSEDETSLDQSQLDLDLDCNSSLSEVDGVLPVNLPDLPPLPGRGMQVPSGAGGPSAGTSADGAAAELGNMSLGSPSRGVLERSVSGAESSESVDSDSHASLSRSGSLKREVYGCEQEESEASECSSGNVQTKETGQIKDVSNTTATSTLPKADSSDVPADGTIEAHAAEKLASSISESAEAHQQNETVTTADTDIDKAHVGHDFIEKNQKLESDSSVINESTQNQQCTSSDCVLTQVSDDSVLETEDKQVLPSEVHIDNNNGSQSESQDVSAASTAEKSLDNGEWI